MSAHAPARRTSIRDLLKDDDSRTVSRTAFGLGVGAGIGFVAGGPVGAGIGALAGGALGALSDGGPQPGELSPARGRLFWKAMASSNAEGIAKAAEILDAGGCHDEADMLRQRVRLLALPEEEAEKRQATLLRALCSGKVAGVEKVATFFRAQGAVVAAALLDTHVADLRAAAAGSVDAARLERLEKRATFAREHGAPAESIASAEANVASARAVMAAPAP